MPSDLRKDSPSDKTMVRRARQGDRAAFLTLLRRYDPRLRRLAVRLLADPRRVDRILGRAYAKAWRSIPFLQRGESVSRWLYRIVYNACVNEMRWEPDRQPPPPPLSGHQVPLPATSTERRLLALRALEATQRIPLVLVDGEGFSLEDTARITRRAEEDVAQDLALARGRFRAYLTGEPLPEAEPLPDVADHVSGTPSDHGTADVPAEVRASLATLGVPTATKEPGGHVRLLGHDHGELTPQAVVASKPPPVPARRLQLAPGESNGEGGTGFDPADESVSVVRPDREGPPPKRERSNDAMGSGDNAGESRAGTPRGDSRQ